MKRLLQKKYLIFIIPAVLLLILLIAAAPGAIYREHHYRTAMNALHEGDLTAAQDLLSDIPMYRDSDTILNFEIPYIKADGLMAAAESGDSTMLETAGFTAADLKEDTTVSMLLYRAATDAFEALGDYKDSADMVSECLYRRACEMLSFCEENKTRGIYVFSSSDPSVESLVSMPGSVLTTLGSERVFQLKQCFTRDGVQFNYEESPSADAAYVPVCEATALEFEALGDYKDSKDLAARARAAGNYTAEFYQLLADGELEKAHEWLSLYGDDVPNADQYDGQTY